MNRITFLLGAGASFNAVPLTYEIPRHLSFMAGYIQKNFDSERSLNYINDIKELITHLNDFNTIDNYARILFQSRNSDNALQLKKLKSILCGLFMFEQLKKKNEIINKFDNVSNEEIERMKRTVDLRYKSLFAKVLTDNKLDETINIISWNYDIQLEIGLESNLGYNYDELQNSCIIYPHPACQISQNGTFNFDWNKAPKIVKLNGTAGIFLKEKLFHNIYLNQQEFFEDRFDTLLDIHNEIKRYSNYSPFLKFAWEKDDNSTTGIQFAKSIISRTDILVVIGYSFPDFNRPVDQEVFSQNRIDEIFVQLPSDDFENVKYNMRSALGTLAQKSVHIKTLREFFIPSQFIPTY